MSSKILNANGENILESQKVVEQTASETVPLVNVVDKFHKLLAKSGITITARNEDSLFSTCGVFFVSEETGTFGYHPNSTLPAELASAVATTFFKICCLLGYSEKVAAMAAVYPTNHTHTEFATDPEVVKELTEKFFSTMYRQKMESESRIIVGDPRNELMKHFRVGRK